MMGRFFFKKTVDQRMERVLIFQSWVSAFAAALRANHARTIDHHDLGNVQSLVWPPSQEAIHDVRSGKANRKSKFGILRKISHFLRVRAGAEDDSHGLESPWAQGPFLIEKLQIVEQFVTWGNAVTPIPFLPKRGGCRRIFFAASGPSFSAVRKRLIPLMLQEALRATMARTLAPEPQVNCSGLLPIDIKPQYTSRPSWRGLPGPPCGSGSRTYAANRGSGRTGPRARWDATG